MNTMTRAANHGHIYSDPTCECSHCVARRASQSPNEKRRKLDADILMSVYHSATQLTFLIAAQTVRGASDTARALRDSGYEVTVRVWNGRAYSEEWI